MLHHLSMSQVLSLWTSLEEAFTNTHSFAGSVAEIYIYRAMPRDPSIEAYVQRGHRRGSPFDDEIEADFRNARAALLALFRLFEQERDAKLEIERVPNAFVELGDWFVEERNEHRLHVRVTPSARQLEHLRRGHERR